MSVAEFQEALKLQRFNSVGEPDAAIRRIHILTPNAHAVAALILATTRLSAPVLRGFLQRNFSYTKAIKVSAPPDQPTFAMEYHMSYPEWIEVTSPEVLHEGGSDLRRTMNVSFLFQAETPETQLERMELIHLVQASCAVFRYDSSIWDAYSLVDKSFNSDDTEERDTGDQDTDDQTSLHYYYNRPNPPWASETGDIGDSKIATPGSFDAEAIEDLDADEVHYDALTIGNTLASGNRQPDVPYWCPRHYFLTIMKYRTERALQGWRDTAYKLEINVRAGIDSRHISRPLQPSGINRARREAESLERRDEWASKAKDLVQKLIDEICRNLYSWNSFQQRDADRFRKNGSGKQEEQLELLFFEISEMYADLENLLPDLKILLRDCENFQHKITRAVTIKENRGIDLQHWALTLFLTVIRHSFALVALANMAVVAPNMAALETQLGSLGLDSPLPDIPTLDVLTKPLDIYRSHLAGLLAAAVGCDISVAYEAITSTSDIEVGDLAVILPRLKLNAADLGSLATDITQKLPTSPLLSVPYTDGVHLRMFFSKKTISHLLLPYIRERGSSYGAETAHGPAENVAESGRKIVIEFSSPNLASSFTPDHLRSTLIGEFISRTHESMGWNVTRLNYIGDWGKHIGLLAAGWTRFGSDDQLQGDDPLGHILDVYSQIMDLFKPEQDLSRQAKNDEEAKAEIESRGIFAERDAFFRRMEDGDDEALALWNRWREVSIAHFKAAYDRLGIQFDEYSGESKVKPETIAQVETTLREKGICEEIDGSLMINFSNHGEKGKGLGTQPIRGRTGSTTYLLRDIAAVLDREAEYSFDKMIYVVSARQTLHFQQVLRALELMGREDLAAKIKHISFGGIQSMPAHLKNARTLTTILDGARELILESQSGGEESGSGPAVVGDDEVIAGLLSQDMSSRLTQGYTFDPKKLSLADGDSRPNLLGYLAKLSSTVANLRASGAGDVDPDYTVLEDETYVDILRVMAQYPDVVASTYKSLEPHGVLAYLNRLVYALSARLDEAKPDADPDEAGPSTAGEGDEISPEGRRAQLELYECAKQVLENSLNLLGFPIVNA
ncbi:uncharacterized protein DNG_07039 [Cephalotrichum gorgonifer]|uniref:arginine--tRNA ligase n=1 Tax=Cephalotrichum gorgonifer TaxID=2041049 RepID=A0AAE8N2L2_9PEZI|nr:uncharacterized protein DNG_07039 [Cephalotrichum gorgonifer]